MTEKFKGRTRLQNISVVVGIAVFVLMQFFPHPEGLSAIGWKVLSVSILMVIYWMTEAIPIAATALLPILLFPLLGITGAKNQNDIKLFSLYGYKTIFLVLGAGFLATAMKRWNLHRRIALGIVRKVGSNVKMIILGFIIATGFVSMWMSNTTATVMMLPVAISIIKSLEGEIDEGFGKALILSIPFAATLGGMATSIGTTTNPTGIGIISEVLDYNISFGSWLKIGLPFTIVMLPLCWIYMVKFFKVDKMKAINIEIVDEEYHKLGAMSKGEKYTSIIFAFAIIAWVTQFLWGKWIPFATDETIAIAIAVLTLIIPVDWKKGVMVLQGKEAFEDAPWTTMLLLAGSMVMGNAITDSGVAAWIAGMLGGLQGMPSIVVIIIVSVVTAVLTEVTTNAVVVASFLPILAGVAQGLGMDPLQLMLICMIASNFAFMLPAGTPPNAIAYSSGNIEMKDMIKAGLGLKIIALIAGPLIMQFITFGLLGIGLN